MKLYPGLKKELIYYIKEKMRSGGTAPTVTIVAPYELTYEEVDMLKQRIPLLRETNVKVEVDDKMLAGIIIRYGSKMIDLSVRSELHKLEQTLYETA